MCDTQKYKIIFSDIKKLTQKDTAQLVIEADSDDEKKFFELIGDFLIQQRQDECIARNVF